jgi:general secretion pathway protein N
MRGLIATGVATTLLGLIIMLPARVAIGWFVPSEIAISGIHGSIWTGGANEAAVNGVYVRDVEWRVNPLHLITGKLASSISATPVGGFFEANISMSLSGRLILSDLSAAVPLGLFADAANVSGLQGNASLSFERVEIVEGLVVAADGTLRIADLVVPIVDGSSLGGYKADFFTQNNGIAASIEDTDGVLDLAGSLQVRTDRSFEFIAQVVAKPETSAGVRRQLQFLPPANDRGQQELRLEGIL